MRRSFYFIFILFLFSQFDFSAWRAPPLDLETQTGLTQILKIAPSRPQQKTAASSAALPSPLIVITNNHNPTYLPLPFPFLFFPFLSFLPSSLSSCQKTLLLYPSLYLLFLQRHSNLPPALLQHPPERKAAFREITLNFPPKDSLVSLRALPPCRITACRQKTQSHYHSDSVLVNKILSAFTTIFAVLRRAFGTDLRKCEEIGIQQSE